MRSKQREIDFDEIFRLERARVLATLIRILGDFDLAEDSMQAAFVAALEQWKRDGVPDNPRAWLISTGRFKAVDAIRRKTRLFASLQVYAENHGDEVDPFLPFDDSIIEDDRLRLILICCHDSLSQEAQAALVLREICGLTTEEIAHAFLTSASTIAQRIVRAKAKIRQERISFELPEIGDMPRRIQGVLIVAYLLFNEGYHASAGDDLTRPDLCAEALRLTRTLTELVPAPEVFGLLALMLLHECRRKARTDNRGDVVLFDEQDHRFWDLVMLAEGMRALAQALDCAVQGIYAIQASIVACHLQGALDGQKNWEEIIRLYDRLLMQNPSPVIELNRAVAVAMHEGPSVGLAIADKLVEGGTLTSYALAHSTRADFRRNLGMFKEAAESYARALDLSTQIAQREFLQRRLAEMIEKVGGDVESSTCTTTH